MNEDLLVTDGITHSLYFSLLGFEIILLEKRDTSSLVNEEQNDFTERSTGSNTDLRVLVMKGWISAWQCAPSPSMQKPGF